MSEVLRQLERSSALRELLVSRAPICFMCSWCLRDLDENERFTGWPLDWNRSPLLPVEGKIIHFILELNLEPPSDPQSLDDLASVVAHALEEERSW